MTTSTEPSTSSILVVDDDETFGKIAAKLLYNAGFRVDFVQDYREVLRLLESDHPIDLLIADIVMPKQVNGLALGRMARLRRPTLKLLYVTGYDIPGITNEALGPVLRKPVDDELLLREVYRVLAAAASGPPA